MYVYVRVRVRVCVSMVRNNGQSKEISQAWSVENVTCVLCIYENRIVSGIGVWVGEWLVIGF